MPTAECRGVGRRAAAVIVGVALVPMIVSGCRTSGAEAHPPPESPQIKALEVRIAEFTAQRPSASGVDTPARCETRVLGRLRREVYFEMECSDRFSAGSSPAPGCVPADATGDDTVGVATLTANNQVSNVRSDLMDDDAYGRWLTRNLPVGLYAYEKYGPRIDLGRRMQSQYGCTR